MLSILVQIGIVTLSIIGMFLIGTIVYLLGELYE